MYRQYNIHTKGLLIVTATQGIHYAAVLIGRITRCVRPSVCLSVCPARVPNSETKMRTIVIGADVPRGRSSRGLSIISKA